MTEPGRSGSSDGCWRGPSVPWNGPLSATIEIVIATPGGAVALSGTFAGALGEISSSAGCAVTVVGGPGGMPWLMVTTPRATKPSESVTRNVKASSAPGALGV